MNVMGQHFIFPFTVSRRLQTVVVYLPDIWTIMPTLEEWEALCQQKAAEAAPPPPEVPAVRPRLTNQ